MTEVTNGQIDPAHYGPTGDIARHIASYCQGNARAHVYTAAFAALATARAEAEAKDAEIADLREAGNVLRDKLLGFVGAMAMYADCGPDVEAIKAWEAI